MTDSLLQLVLLVTLGCYIVHALWKVICSGSPIALIAIFAGYLVSAILCKAALPSLAGVALWLPFLYPYAWMGVSALLWFACTARAAGVTADEQDQGHVELKAYFHSQLSLHFGVLLLSMAMPWQSWWLYLFFPPLLVGMGYFWYRMRLWWGQQRSADICIRRGSTLLVWLAPLSLLAVTARLTPLILTLI